MKILLHICCAPCSVMCIADLRAAGHDLTGFWYNPNIHPFTEYVQRKTALETYAKSISLPLILRDEYGLRKFVDLVKNDVVNRCPVCYKERLVETAKVAKAQGFDAFTTTLLISPYQKHETLKIVAEAVAQEIGIPFHYVDFRSDFREGQRIARTLPLYMQKYCGCIFSEEERYIPKSK